MMIKKIGYIILVIQLFSCHKGISDMEAFRDFVESGDIEYIIELSNEVSSIRYRNNLYEIHFDSTCAFASCKPYRHEMFRKDAKNFFFYLNSNVRNVIEKNGSDISKIRVLIDICELYNIEEIGNFRNEVYHFNMKGDDSYDFCFVYQKNRNPDYANEVGGNIEKINENWSLIRIEKSR